MTDVEQIQNSRRNNGEPVTDVQNRLAGVSVAEASTPPDPYDPANLRLGQDFGESVAVKKVLMVVPCRKPNRHEFVRVRAGAEWRLETAAFEDKVNRETYLVDRALWPDLAGEINPVCLFLAISRQGDVFLWPAKMPGVDGRSNNWNDSALAAASLAETKWVRVAANMGAGMYDAYQASGELSDPEWPDLSLSAILKLAFKDKFLRDVDHPVLKALRGE